MCDMAAEKGTTREQLPRHCECSGTQRRERYARPLSKHAVLPRHRECSGTQRREIVMQDPRASMPCYRIQGWWWWSREDNAVAGEENEALEATYSMRRMMAPSRRGSHGSLSIEMREKSESANISWQRSLRKKGGHTGCSIDKSSLRSPVIWSIKCSRRALRELDCQTHSVQH